MNKNNTSIQTIKNPLNYCELKAKNFCANITERKGLKNREEMCKKIIELIDKGYNISEIGIELNRSEYCIKGYIKYCKQKNLLIS